MEAEERPSKLRKLSHNHDHDRDHDSRLRPAPPQTTEPSHPTDSEAEDENEISIDVEERKPAPASATAASLKSTLNAQMDRTSDAEGQPPEPVLSKNQLKKLKRKAEWEAGREDRKLKRKEKEKEKKARKRAAREEGVQHQAEDVKGADVQADVLRKKSTGYIPRKRRQHLPIALVIDCAFDDLMVEKERISLGSQITRCYSDNNKAPFQAHLYVSGWTEGSELRKRFEGLLKGMYKNWRGMVFTEEDFVEAAWMAEGEMRGWEGGRMVGAFERYASAKDKGRNGDNGATNTQGGGVEQGAEADDEPANTDVASEPKSEPLANGATHASDPVLQDLQEAGEVIYLTSDSPYTLTELKPYHTYIIGGLVDKNRHKGICYKTARDKNAKLQASSSISATTETNGSATTTVGRYQEIKTAKLPIGEHMSMTARHVLATNHVVEIMLRWLETRDWGEAFMSVMPKRKGGVLRNIKAEDEDDEEEGGATVLAEDGQDETEAEDEHEPNFEGEKSDEVALPVESEVVA
ncbi:tRNA (guanine(9)-N(1))-methyltransferase [Knufia obscura]|uniref:tRNA (guanine(9)-N1)-methyltransferase n=1 Tax=Knufia obscura TaxID=1635080 RepID=A0ABR0RPN5_9EURO|nr:tRNA (guanine(9)-N(1))-methyltransferase [Knufia obscura]